MKRIIAGIVLLCMIFSFAGCVGGTGISSSGSVGSGSYEAEEEPGLYEFRNCASESDEEGLVYSGWAIVIDITERGTCTFNENQHLYVAQLDNIDFKEKDKVWIKIYSNGTISIKGGEAVDLY